MTMTNESDLYKKFHKAWQDATGRTMPFNASFHQAWHEWYTYGQTQDVKWGEDQIRGVAKYLWKKIKEGKGFLPQTYIYKFTDPMTFHSLLDDARLAAKEFRLKPKPPTPRENALASIGRPKSEPLEATKTAKEALYQLPQRGKILGDLMRKAIEE